MLADRIERNVRGRRDETDPIERLRAPAARYAQSSRQIRLPGSRSPLRAAAWHRSRLPALRAPCRAAGRWTSFFRARRACKARAAARAHRGAPGITALHRQVLRQPRRGRNAMPKSTKTARAPTAGTSHTACQSWTTLRQACAAACAIAARGICDGDSDSPRRRRQKHRRNSPGHWSRS